MTEFWKNRHLISKKVYLSLFIFFLLYAVNIMFDNLQGKDSLSRDNSYQVLPAIVFEVVFKDENYVFKNSAWTVVSQKKKLTAEEEAALAAKLRNEVIAIKVDTTKSPITICAKKRLL
ncbi:hypothetical protein JHD50_10610 [Sulfurimonas sp. MAG313]|nr:hypothetical protein [Sulfurimonas sp. MAG313]MDF1881743.1 hypothetical protein [Sulfurimonas sp. MAG313]